MIIAKPVIPDRYWILKENDKKIGNIEVEAGGYKVRIADRIEIFPALPNIKKKINIDFLPIETKSTAATDNKSVYGYSTTHQPHNAVYDVKHQVPLWTHDTRSRSWYAAGWYRVKQGRHWSVVHCPKLIVIQRYPYKGPFHTEDQAQSAE